MCRTLSRTSTLLPLHDLRTWYRRLRPRSYERATSCESRHSAAQHFIDVSMRADSPPPYISAVARAAGESARFRTGSATQKATAHQPRRNWLAAEHAAVQESRLSFKGPLVPSAYSHIDMFPARSAPGPTG